MPVLSSTLNQIPLKHACPDYSYVKFRYIYICYLPSTMSGLTSFWSISLPGLGFFEVHCSWRPNYIREELARFHFSHKIKEKEQVNLSVLPCANGYGFFQTSRDRFQKIDIQISPAFFQVLFWHKLLYFILTWFPHKCVQIFFFLSNWIQ